MNSSTSNATPSEEFLNLKEMQRYSHIPEEIIREWIRRPIEPLPVTRVGKTTMIPRSTFNRWLASNEPVVAELSSRFGKEPASASFFSRSSMCRDGRSAMAWVASNHFKSLADAWEHCEWGDWMLWLLERDHPLTEPQWEELERTLKPFWSKRFMAQSSDDNKQAIAEFERGKANVLRQILGNPWRSQNAHASN